MKKLILLLVIASPAFCQRFANTYTYVNPSISVGSQAQTTAATWFATGWMPWFSRTISKVRVYASGSTGSPSTSGDVTLSICPDSSGSPGTCGSPLATSSTITSATAPGWIEFTGFSLAVTAYTQYWFVITNTSAGATKQFTWRYYTATTPNFQTGGFTGQNVKTSTNSGSAWTTAANAVCGVRVEYTGSVFDGTTLQNFGVVATTNEQIYSTHEYGAVFTMPSNVSMNLKGCGFVYQASASPTGNLRCRVYSDNGTTATLLGTSDTTYPLAQVDTSARFGAFIFTTPIALTAGTKYRVVLGETTQSDSSTNHYTPTAFTVDSDSNSLPLMPMAGTLTGAYCLATCTTSSNWVVVYDVPAFSIMMDPAREFNSTGSSGGIRVSGYVH